MVLLAIGYTLRASLSCPPSCSATHSRALSLASCSRVASLSLPPASLFSNSLSLHLVVSLSFGSCSLPCFSPHFRSLVQGVVLTDLQSPLDFNTTSLSLALSSSREEDGQNEVVPGVEVRGFGQRVTNYRLCLRARIFDRVCVCVCVCVCVLCVLCVCVCLCV